MTTIRARFGTPRKTPPPKPVSRAALQLALAHHIERLVEVGELADYAAAARALGLTRARLTQVIKLGLLSPRIQELILCGKLRASERRMRAVVADPVWVDQFERLAAGCERSATGGA